jgi:hypothetical protein
MTVKHVIAGVTTTDACNSTVSVEDNTKPVITCPAIRPSIPVNDLCYGELVAFRIPASDNCDVGITNARPFSTISSGTGLFSSTFFATDVYGNVEMTPCSFDVFDDIKPTLTCPADPMNVMADASCMFTLPDAFVVEAVDNCPGTLITRVLTSGKGVGVQMVNFTGTDVSNNTATISCPLTVQDTSELTIVCPPTKYFTAQSSCVADVPFPFNAVVQTACGTVSATLSLAMNPYVLGTTPVSISLLLPSGVTISCNTSVVVSDSDPDGACGTDDMCPGTSLAKEVPMWRVRKDSYIAAGALSLTNGFTFTSTSGTGSTNTSRVYTTKDTGGCTCAQIIASCKYRDAFLKYGCPADMLDVWTGKYSQVGQAKYQCSGKYNKPAVTKKMEMQKSKGRGPS